MADESAAGFDIAAFAKAFDHHALEFGQNIDAIFKHMRGHCPVARTESYGGFWVLTRYADIVRVARDVVRGAIPYVLLLILGLFIVWAFPQLSLWLPQTAGFGR